MTSQVFDSRQCQLGEGPLWHPERQQFFWFDILSRQLLSVDGSGPRTWQFDEYVSAAGWVDRDTLLMASETGLWRFSIETGERFLLMPLESDNPVTRSNDGRADPWGGFWIGTMGINAEDKAGAIYRFYKGELRVLYPDISIPNAICFAPDRSAAYYADTATQLVMRQPLNGETGWPEETASVFLDLRDEALNPDGAVIDADGNMWLAQWGAERVAVYAPDGAFLKSVAFEARQTSCPAFGGPNLTDLYCTSAAVGLDARIIAAQPTNGATFIARKVGLGQAEHRVML